MIKSMIAGNWDQTALVANTGWRINNGNNIDSRG